MNVEELTAYISPELTWLVFPLYVVGYFIKHSQRVSDRFIPLVLGGVSIVICWLYEFMSLGFGFEALFCGIVQGILLAGVTVYGNQVWKQIRKAE